MDQQEFEAQRRKRNIALAVALAGLVVLFFVVTVVKLGANIS